MSRPFRLATFNIHHGAPPHRRVDHRGLVEACRTLDADVLALQEVDCRAWRTRLVDQAGRVAWNLGMHHAFDPNRSLGVFGRYGNALLSRGRLLAVEHLSLPTPPPLEPRGAILARVAVADGVLTVAATHLANRGTREGPHPARPQLDALLARLVEVDGPTVLMGDLNLGPELAGAPIEAAGFTRADAPPTFPSDGPRISIDWVAVRGLEVVATEVPMVAASDHRPLVATCTFR
jgi:endonuclease/exonuclease/phosphatase family metal-dependent hydrolase